MVAPKALEQLLAGYDATKVWCLVWKKCGSQAMLRVFDGNTDINTYQYMLRSLMNWILYKSQENKKGSFDPET